MRTKLDEDLQNILKGKVKQSLFDSLLDANEFEVPASMISSEISNMKQDTARRMGMDPKEMKEDLYKCRDIFCLLENLISINKNLSLASFMMKTNCSGNNLNSLCRTRFFT